MTRSTWLRRTAHILLPCSFLAVTAQADITLEEKLSVEGAGMMSMANMTGRTTTMISGKRARTETDVQMQSKLVRTFARGMGPTAEITRLEDDKIYSLDLKRKTYTESSFTERRAELQKALEQQQQAQQQQRQGTSGVDESQCEWLPPKAEVKRTGEKAMIAGLSAERQIVSATQSCKDKKTGQVCDFGLTLDQWLAPGFNGGDEALAYQKAFAEKMGLNASGSRDFLERAQGMFAGYQGIWSEIAKQIKDVKGYPVKSSFSLGVGGPQCQNAQQQQASQQNAPPGGIAGQIGGALGGMFGGRKKQESEPAAAEKPAAPTPMPNGLFPLMTISTELISVSSQALAPQTFEVPSDFKPAKN